MGELSSVKADAVAAFVRSLPDETLHTLKLGLATPAAVHGMGPVQDAIVAELADRRLRRAVLAELEIASGVGRLFAAPLGAGAGVWGAIRAHAAQAVATLTALHSAREAEAFEAAALDLVRTAAEAIRAGEPVFQTALAKLEGGPAAAERVQRILRLAPLVRASTSRARAWLKQGGAEEASSLRLAIRDASALFSDGGPMLIDLMAGQFTEKFAGLRLVCAVMDRPNESFLAGSEFAPFALNALAVADEAVEALRRPSLLSSRAEGAALAAGITAALEGLEELEHAVQLDRERPWGRQVSAQRRALALAAEARLKEADGRVAAALPVRNPRPGLKQVRGAPCFSDPLDWTAVGRAEASLAFIEGVRRASATGGFGGLRAKVIEALDSRVETYVEDLLEQLHADGAAGKDDLVERLQVAADLWALVRDPSAAQIVRRRMAAAA